MKKPLHNDPRDFSFATAPEKYHHISLNVDGDEATIVLNVNAEQGLFENTLLKLNSYDLSVDIELADAINRLRFEHPEVGVVTITSGHPQIFSAGANIYMLKKSSHAFKVNFCKFTNETRLYLEEASAFSHKRFLCALNGTAAGGGYELALACDRIVLLDDKSANVSLPEVPLLGVLPGTGGLTRLTDKRQIRRDRADVFCTVSEGIKGLKAKDWDLVDAVYTKSQWKEGLAAEVALLKAALPKDKPRGIKLEPLMKKVHEAGFSYDYVDVVVNADRSVRMTLEGPTALEPTEVNAMMEKGSRLWLLRAFLELDDALLNLRFFYRDHGLIEFHVHADPKLVLAAEEPLYNALNPQAHWFLREVLLLIGRSYKRLDMSSRSLVAIVDKASGYAGVLAEILLACDRSYGLIGANPIHLSPINWRQLFTWSGRSRIEARFSRSSAELAQVKAVCNASPLDITVAEKIGLLTFALDDIDFHDEIRIFKEERASLSPDALSAMEANLRINGPETLATKIFGRLSAWQNWVFTRDNATGERGALISYGEEKRPEFWWERC